MGSVAEEPLHLESESLAALITTSEAESGKQEGRAASIQHGLGHANGTCVANSYPACVLRTDHECPTGNIGVFLEAESRDRTVYWGGGGQICSRLFFADLESDCLSCPRRRDTTCCSLDRFLILAAEDKAVILLRCQQGRDTRRSEFDLPVDATATSPTVALQLYNNVR
jgi:hypothetical protein